VRHSIVVGVIQAVLAHTLLPTNPVGELPEGPKLVPRIVTTAPDFAGPFSVAVSVTTGESYVNALDMVPMAPCLENDALSAPPLPGGMLHRSMVSET